MNNKLTLELDDNILNSKGEKYTHLRIYPFYDNQNRMILSFSFCIITGSGGFQTVSIDCFDENNFKVEVVQVNRKVSKKLDIVLDYLKQLNKKVLIDIALKRYPNELLKDIRNIL